jgi:hypothetical protein
MDNKHIKKLNTNIFETLNNFVGGVRDHMRIQGLPVEGGNGGGYSQRPKHVIIEWEEEGGVKSHDLTLYHGTPTNFEEFETGSFGRHDGGYLGRGIYFTNDYSYAESYTTNNGENNGYILTAKITVKNPYIVTDKIYGTRPLAFNSLIGTNNSSHTTKKLKDMGYDSVILKHESDDTYDRDDELQDEFIELCVFDTDNIEIINKEIIGDGEEVVFDDDEYYDDEYEEEYEFVEYDRDDYIADNDTDSDIYESSTILTYESFINENYDDVKARIKKSIADRKSGKVDTKIQNRTFNLQQELDKLCRLIVDKMVDKTYESAIETKKFNDRQPDKNEIPRVYVDYISPIFMKEDLRDNVSDFDVLQEFMSSCKLTIEFMTKSIAKTKKGYDSDNEGVFKPDSYYNSKVIIYIEDSVVEDANTKTKESNIEDLDRSDFNFIIYPSEDTFSTLLHEMKHAYDYWISNGKAVKQSKEYTDRKNVVKKIKSSDNITDSDREVVDKQFKEYRNLPHEIEARLAQALKDTSAIDVNVGENGVEVNLKPWKEYFDSVKLFIRGWKDLPTKQQNRITKKIRKYYWGEKIREMRRAERKQSRNNKKED